MSARFVDEGLAWLEPVETKEAFYSEDQPRADDGKWTSGGADAAIAKVESAPDAIGATPPEREDGTDGGPPYMKNPTASVSDEQADAYVERLMEPLPSLDDARQERLPIASLRTPQDVVEKARVSAILKSGHIHGDVVVLRIGGVDYLHDGNHRVAALHLLGHTHVRAKVIDFDKGQMFYSEDEARDDAGRWTDGGGTEHATPRQEDPTGHLSPEAHGWLNGYQYGMPGVNAENVRDPIPSDKVIRELAAYVTKQPVALARAEYTDAPTGERQVTSWSRYENDAKQIAEGNDRPMRILRDVVSPDRIIVDTTRLPAAYRKEHGAAGQHEVIVAHGALADRVRRIRAGEHFAAEVFYSEDQPRDENGRWTGGGSSAILDRAPAEWVKSLSADAGEKFYSEDQERDSHGRWTTSFDSPGADRDAIASHMVGLVPPTVPASRAAAVYDSVRDAMQRGVEAAQKQSPTGKFRDAKMDIALTLTRLDPEKVVMRGDVHMSHAPLTEAVKAGHDLVPVVVGKQGDRYFLQDGHHRMRGYADAGKPALAWVVEVKPGTGRVHVASTEPRQRFYSEDQPRDEAGRWTDTGGGSAAAKEAEGVALYRKSTELTKEELEAQRARNREITRKWREKKNAEKKAAGGKLPEPTKPEPTPEPKPEPEKKPGKRSNASFEDLEDLNGVSKSPELEHALNTAREQGIVITLVAEPKETADHPSMLDGKKLFISYDAKTGLVNYLTTGDPSRLHDHDIVFDHATASRIVDELRRQQREGGPPSAPTVYAMLRGSTKHEKAYANAVARIPAEHLDSLRSVTFEAKQAASWAGRYQWTRAIQMGANYHGSEKVLLHEMGHHVHLSKLTDAAAEEWNQISRMTPKGERISRYAGKNRGEHFAEAYSAYHGKEGDTDVRYQGSWFVRENLAKREPLAHDFMERLSKPNSGMLLPNGRTASNPQSRYRVTRGYGRRRGEGRGREW